MDLIRKHHKKGTIIIKKNTSPKLYFDEDTGTVRIFVKTDDPNHSIFSATPVIMSNRFRRDIKK